MIVRWLRPGDDAERGPSAEADVEEAVERLNRTLAPLHVSVTLEKADPDPVVDPSSSTGIWIDDRALERWLGAQPPEDGSPALVIDGETYERVTVDLVCRAGMLAASYLLDACSRGRCLRRPGALRMGCGACCGRSGGCVAHEE